MQTRRASIKETGEELSAAEWERFDVAVAGLKAERGRERPPKEVTPSDAREARTVEPSRS